MASYEADSRRFLEVLQDYDGKHSHFILTKVMERCECGPVRAGNLVKHLVRTGQAHEKGLRFYVGGRK